MRSLESAATSWQALKQIRTLEELREAARLDGKQALTNKGLRSASWKAFLLFDSVDFELWPNTLASSRSAYNALRMHFMKHLENPDEFAAGSDPLTGEGESTPWTLLQKDEDLREEILQDVKRCMQENPYFRLPETQQMLLDILFIFSKLNPDVSYRQGMHELAAPVLWAVHQDAIEVGVASKAMGEDATIKAVFDAEHIEHDTFALFGQIMHSAKSFYEQTTHHGRENPMVKASQRIFNDLLPIADPHLARHLAGIGIVSEVFLMRWIRLLFGREFEFEQTLNIWDVIFAEDPSLAIVDHICIIMLLHIRWRLLEADCNGAMDLLMHFHDLKLDVNDHGLVVDAMYFRDHMDTEAGNYLILKYTGRPPLLNDRASTPPALQRNITTFSGVNALKAVSSSQPSRQPRTIEDVLQSTARSIYAGGERLGIGRTVRNAVDEVHKRAQELREAQAPSPPMAWRARPSRSAPDAFLAKIKAMEQRNRDLANLLEEAVAELWDFQKLVAEAQEGRKEATEAAEAGSIERLSLAIAKVQFVQVYLADASLPLPEKETQSSNNEPNPVEAPPPDKERTGDMVILQDPEYAATTEPTTEKIEAQLKTEAVADNAIDAGVHIVQVTTPSFQELADPASFEDDFEETSAETEPYTNKKRDDTATDLPASEAKGTHATRPSLGQSSFSWMLGQQTMESESPGGSSPLQTTRARARGFLFGDEEESDEVNAFNAGEENQAFDLSTLRRGKGVQK